MIPKNHCEELERLEHEAALAYRKARAIRRSRDISIQEDCQLAHDVQEKIDALILHLLAGHKNQPCPSGDRPIIRPSGVSRSSSSGAKARAISLAE